MVAPFSVAADRSWLVMPSRSSVQSMVVTTSDGAGGGSGGLGQVRVGVDFQGEFGEGEQRVGALLAGGPLFGHLITVGGGEQWLEGGAEQGGAGRVEHRVEVDGAVVGVVQVQEPVVVLALRPGLG